MSRRAAAVAAVVAVVLPLFASPAQALPVAGLRGQAVAAATCPTSSQLAAALTSDQVTHIGGMGLKITVCPQVLGLPNDQVGSPIVVATKTKAQKMRFVALVAALSLPDRKAKPSATPMPCPMYADVERVVYASTITRVWRVHIPTDACGHFQAAALKALGAVDARQKLGA